MLRGSIVPPAEIYTHICILGVLSLGVGSTLARPRYASQQQFSLLPLSLPEFFPTAQSTRKLAFRYLSVNLKFSSEKRRFSRSVITSKLNTPHIVDWDYTRIPVIVLFPHRGGCIGARDKNKKGIHFVTSLPLFFSLTFARLAIDWPDYDREGESLWSSEFLLFSPLDLQRNSLWSRITTSSFFSLAHIVVTHSVTRKHTLELSRESCHAVWHENQQEELSKQTVKLIEIGNLIAIRVFRLNFYVKLL